MALDKSKITQHQRDLRHTARQLPEYKRLMQRRYREPSGYSTVIEVLERVCCGMLPWAQGRRINPNIDFPMATAAELALPFCTSVPAPPIYWLSEDLLQALLDSDISGDAVSNLPIPHFTMLLMLPKGVLISPDGESVDYLLWQHREAGLETIISYQGESITAKATGVADDVQALLWSSVLPSGITYASYQGLSANYFDDRPFNVDQIEMVEAITRLNPEEEERAFQKKLTSLIVQVICILTAKPDLFELNATDQKAIGLSQRKAKALYQPHRLLSPNWIGKDYRRPSGMSQGGTHASPVAHFRRGHWRMQAMGEGRKQHKRIWIQPTIVSLDKED